MDLKGNLIIFAGENLFDIILIIIDRYETIYSRMVGHDGH